MPHQSEPFRDLALLPVPQVGRLLETGDRALPGAFRGHFNDLVRRAGLKPTSPRCRPRLHDFRHRFACLTLED